MSNLLQSFIFNMALFLNILFLVVSKLNHISSRGSSLVTLFSYSVTTFLQKKNI